MVRHNSRDQMALPDNGIELAGLIRRKRISAEEVTRDRLDAADRLNPSLHAFTALYHERAVAAAQRVDRAIARRREIGPLAGVPFSVKDLIVTSDGPTTLGSRCLGAGLPAAPDAIVVRRLKRAGAILIGKANLHEAALGVTSANDHFGAVANPRAPGRVAGGSSGGSAAAIAAGLTPISVGTDTRGSIRIPASCCGVVGLKPTFGHLPLGGVYPLAESLDHVGPMAGTVEDVALALGVMEGGANSVARRLAETRRSTRRLRLGISSYHLGRMEPDVERVVMKGIALLRKLVKTTQDVRLEIPEVHRASAVITASEALSVHDTTVKTNPGGYGRLVRERLEGGRVWSAVDYLLAQRERLRAHAIFTEAFDSVDVLVGATIPAAPPPVGEQTVSIAGIAESVVDAFTRFNGPQNMAGVPSMSVPFGSAGGAPVGLQLISAHGREDLLLSLAGAFARFQRG